MCFGRKNVSSRPRYLGNVTLDSARNRGICLKVCLITMHLGVLPTKVHATSVKIGVTSVTSVTMVAHDVVHLIWFQRMVCLKTTWFCVFYLTCHHPKPDGISGN